MKSSWCQYACENLKSKITFANDLSIRDFLKTAKQDDGSYLSLKNLQELLVSSGSYSITSNLDLVCLEQANVSELKDLFNRLELICFSFNALFSYSVSHHVSFQRWNICISRWALFQFLTKICNVITYYK